MSILGIEFTVSREVNAGQVDRIWQVLSDVSNMPRYWRGHREVEIVGRDGDAYLVKIRFAFPGPGNRGIARIVVSNDEKVVLINYLEGPIRGYVRNYVSENQLVSQWNVRITPLFLLMKPWIRRHFMNGAINALTRIVNETRPLTP
ncbi:hypothetical protein JCM16161A_10060 [Vulcanisaeta sp. JCM 16161]|uniref:SRPBCC family protein n=1 Tax=Vulcanisaeta sp. JCM 16161 TaxID=1295372 RepID=UPI0006CF8D0D|nr:SRPBCC family protein [Vulcanisaeta sp. JCM 16161]